MIDYVKKNFDFIQRQNSGRASKLTINFFFPEESLVYLSQSLLSFPIALARNTFTSVSVAWKLSENREIGGRTLFKWFDRIFKINLYFNYIFFNSRCCPFSTCHVKPVSNFIQRPRNHSAGYTPGSPRYRASNGGSKWGCQWGC